MQQALVGLLGAVVVVVVVFVVVTVDVDPVVEVIVETEVAVVVNELVTVLTVVEVDVRVTVVVTVVVGDGNVLADVEDVVEVLAEPQRVVPAGMIGMLPPTTISSLERRGFWTTP